MELQGSQARLWGLSRVLLATMALDVLRRQRLLVLRQRERQLLLPLLLPGPLVRYKKH